MSRAMVTATCRVPREEAFAYFANPRNAPSFMPLVSACESVSGDPGVGMSAVLRMSLLGRRIASTWVMTRYEPADGFDLSYADDRVEMNICIGFDDGQDGRTVISATCAWMFRRVPGPLARLASDVIRDQVRRSLSAGVAAVEEHVRRSGAEAPNRAQRPDGARRSAKPSATAPTAT